MQVKVESTTDTPEAVIAATGGLAESTVETKVETDKTPASDKKESDETKVASGATEDQETDHDEDGDEDESPDEENKPKKKSRGFKRRIDKLNSRLSEREREIAFLREQMAKAQVPQPKLEEPQKSKESGEPDPDDFDTIKDYTKALTKWEIEQEKKALKAQEKQAEMQKQITAHNKRVEEFAKSASDFFEVLDDVDDIIASPALEELILESENGPQLMYTLAKDRAELERINALSPLAMAREIGRIETKLSQSKESKTETQKITKTPAPLKTVGGSSTGVSSKNPDEMDYEDFKKWRLANS